jgi:hypothetical protein
MCDVLISGYVGKLEAEQIRDFAQDINGILIVTSIYNDQPV